MFFPHAIAGLLERYNFQTFPSPDEFTGEETSTLTFKHGLFQDAAITEFVLYTDGFAAMTSANTDLVEAFLNDFIDWSMAHWKMKDSGLSPKGTYFESAVLAEMKLDEAKLFPLTKMFGDSLKKHQLDYGLGPFDYGFFGTTLAIDSTKHTNRLPAYFNLSRRTATPYEANIYYSYAPLRTADHAKLLSEIEKVAG